MPAASAVCQKAARLGEAHRAGSEGLFLTRQPTRMRVMWRTSRNLLSVLLCVAGACAPAKPDPALPAARPVADEAPSVVATTAATPSALPETPISPPTAPEESLLTFERVLEAPVHFVGYGKSGRAAAIGDDVWLDEGGGFNKLPAPGMETGSVQIFFGRDNKPRLMGYAGSGATAEGVYRRWRGRSWQRGLDEIGKLGGGKTPFFGVLGYADPEVVCRVGDICLIKRLTGWKTAQPPPDLPQVVLAHGQAWALSSAALWRLHNDVKWEAFGGKAPFSAARAMWATSDRDVWVADANGSLHHFDGASWTAAPAIVRAPSGLWAADANNVWLVGSDGAARFDGSTWRRARGPTGPLAHVSGISATDVWLAGKSGLWRGKAASPAK